MGYGLKVKQARAEKVFKRANPEWKIIQPWVKSLSTVYNKAETMWTGNFKAIGPLGNERIVTANVYQDGIRIC